MQELAKMALARINRSMLLSSLAILYKLERYLVMLNQQTDFTQRVIKLINSVPEGRVATYGLIAKLAGNPRGSRGVGWILHSSTSKYRLPWQRIIKSSGKLSFPDDSPKFLVQKKKLQAEGVAVIKGRVDLKKFLWKKIRIEV